MVTIQPHRHCKECNKAVDVEEKFCGKDCENAYEIERKGARRKWTILFAIAFLAMILSLMYQTGFF